VRTVPNGNASETRADVKCSVDARNRTRDSKMPACGRSGGNAESSTIMIPRNTCIPL
jgi:hypothetical protein